MTELEIRNDIQRHPQGDLSYAYMMGMRDKATDKQRGFLRALNIQFPDDISKGQAAMLITNALANKQKVKV